MIDDNVYLAKRPQGFGVISRLVKPNSISGEAAFILLAWPIESQSFFKSLMSLDFLTP